MKYMQCLFCDQQLQKPSTKHNPSWVKQSVINANGANMCQIYGTVNGYQTVKEYMNFYENKYNIVKKSIYERKYYQENTISDICDKYKFVSFRTHI